MPFKVVVVDKSQHWHHRRATSINPVYLLHKEPVKTTTTTTVSRRSVKSEKKKPKHNK